MVEDQVFSQTQQMTWPPPLGHCLIENPVESSSHVLVDKIYVHHYIAWTINATDWFLMRLLTVFLTHVWQSTQNTEI